MRVRRRVPRQLVARAPRAAPGAATAPDRAPGALDRRTPPDRGPGPAVVVARRPPGEDGGRADAQTCGAHAETRERAPAVFAVHDDALEAAEELTPEAGAP